jgi:hypothetical protein
MYNIISAWEVIMDRKDREENYLLYLIDKYRKIKQRKAKN